MVEQVDGGNFKYSHEQMKMMFLFPTNGDSFMKMTRPLLFKG